MSNIDSLVDHSAFYDKFWRNLPIYPTGTERARGEFASRCISDFVGKNNLLILDLGCGRGWMSSYLSKWGKVTGVDFSPEGIEIAQKYYGEHGQFILVKPGDVSLGLPPDQQFDIVVCSEVIEHAENQQILLSQIHHLLKPLGWCILTTPNGRLWKTVSTSEEFQKFIQPVEKWLFPQQVSQMLGVAGFNVRRHEGWAVHGFRQGNRLVRFLQHRKISNWIGEMGLHRFYSKWLLHVAMYQYIAAQKKP